MALTINNESEKGGFKLEPTRQNNAVSDRAHSGVDPSAILNTPPVLDSLQSWVRGLVVRRLLGGWLQDAPLRKGPRTKVSVNGMANRSLLCLVHQTRYAKGEATGLVANRGFESHRTHSIRRED